MKITFAISIGNGKIARVGISKVKLGRCNQNHIIRLMAVIKFINFTCET